MIERFCNVLMSIAAVLVMAASPVIAQTPETEKKTETWAPPAPDPDGFDWILLTSGEWLKGEIIVLREDHFEFDSDEMDELQFDWEDIKEVRSPRQNSLRFEGDVFTKGTVSIKEGLVKVGGEKEMIFDRAKLLTIIPGEPRETSYWDGKFSVGMTARSGNTDQAEMQFLMNLRRRTLSSRFVTDYVGNYGQLDSVENVNNHRLDTKYDLFVTRTFYMTPLSIQLYKDPFQNIRLQATPATGVGFHLLHRGDLKWDVEPALGYRYTKYDSVEAGEDSTTTTFALIGRSFFETDLTKAVDLSLNYSLSVGLSAPQSNIHHFVAQTKVELSDIVDLNVSFTWDRISNPQANSDGTVPKPDDFRLTLGVVIDF